MLARRSSPATVRLPVIDSSSAVTATQFVAAMAIPNGRHRCRPLLSVHASGY